MVYGGNLTLTHSHLYHYWHFPTMVAFCHGGNMPASHHHHHHHHHHYCHIVTVSDPIMILLMQWCTTSQILVDNVTASHAPHLPPALCKLHLSISGGEKVINSIHQHFLNEIIWPIMVKTDNIFIKRLVWSVGLVLASQPWQVLFSGWSNQPKERWEKSVFTAW